MPNHKRSSTWVFIGILACLLIFLSGIIIFSYSNPIARLEHFAFLSEIVSSLATAATLMWLVLERNQLQSEKREDSKRKQAAGVSSWLSIQDFGGRTRPEQEIIILNNNSDAPIYNVVVAIVDARNKDAKGEKTPEEFRRVIDTSPPGQAYCIAPTGYGGMGFHPSVEIAFSDANGSHWVRRGNGRLEDLSEEPFTHYAIFQPPTYELLHPM